MRQATIRLTHRHDVAADPFAGTESVTVESIRYMSPISDGRHVELLELRGDLAEAAETLAADSRIRGYEVTGEDGIGIAYLQRQSSGVIGQLVSVFYGHDIVVDWPIEHRIRGETSESRFSVVGTAASLERAAADLPERVTLELQRIGTLDVEEANPSGPLTSRQQELLELAVREGYYEVPRRTTHRHLAAELDLSVGTVSERLQRIEQRLVASHLDR